MVLAAMRFFRRSVATTIYKTPSLFEIVQIGKNVKKMLTNASGNPYKKQFLKYYLENILTPTTIIFRSFENCQCSPTLFL